MILFLAMKKVILTLGVVGLFFNIAAAKTNDAAPSDILIVNVTEVYNNYYRAQDAQEKLQAIVDAAQAELNRMMEEGTAVAKSLEEIQTKLNNPSLTEDAKKALMEQARPKAEDLQRRENELNQFRQEKQSHFNERRQAIFNLYLGEIGDAANKLAKTKNAKYILNANAVVFASPETNVTDELIKLLNADKDKTPASSSTKNEKKK